MTSFEPVTEFVEKIKIDKKTFINDPTDSKCDFVRIYHDLKWQIGAIVKPLKTKRTYDIILLDLETEDKEDPLWNLHNIDKTLYSKSFELGQELIGKLRKYFEKDLSEDWFVVCKVNTVTQAKKIGYISMIQKEKTFPVKMEFIEFNI